MDKLAKIGEFRPKANAKTTVVLLLVVAFVIAIFTNNICMGKLWKQQNDALGIAAAAAAVATGLAIVPDDTTTPVANQIAGITAYIMISVACIMIERFILQVAPYASLLLMAFAGFLFLLKKMELFRDQARFKILISRLMIVVWCMLMLIPTSLTFDRCIERVLDTDKIIQSAINDGAEEETTEDKNIWEKATEAVGNAVSAVSNALELAKETLSHFLTAIAAMIIITLVVPVVTILILWNVMKWAVGDIMKAVTDMDGHAPLQNEDTHSTALKRVE